MSGARPNPLQWLYFQYSGSLPPAYAQWVLHDGTCSTWMLRVIVRGLVQIVPLAVLTGAALVLLGGSWPLVLGSVLLGVLVVARIALTGGAESVDARLVRHGFPPGHGSTVRQQLGEAAAERYRAVWRREE